MHDYIKTFYKSLKAIKILKPNLNVYANEDINEAN